MSRWEEWKRKKGRGGEDTTKHNITQYFAIAFGHKRRTEHDTSNEQQLISFMIINNT